MNDAKSMLMMYSYAAMKAAEDKEEKATAETTTETKTKAVKEAKKGKPAPNKGKHCKLVDGKRVYESMEC